MNLAMRTGAGDESDRATRLGALLVAAGVIDANQLRRAEAASADAGERLDRVLGRLGLVADGDLADAFAEMTGLARVAAVSFPAEPPLIDTLGLPFLASARLLPLSDDETAVVIAVADPLDRSAIEAVRLKLEKPVEIRIAAASEIEAALERCEKAAQAEAAVPHAEAAAADVARLRDLASEAPVIRVVNQMIRRAAETGASDIHIEPERTGLRVRFRVDGALRPAEAPPAAQRDAVLSRIKIMAQLNIAEQRLPQDGRIQMAVGGRELDLRVATLPTLHGEAVVMRLLDRSGLVLDFAGLGFAPDAAARLNALITRPNGVLLVTGPTGSGKTTTLYAAIQALNADERKIVTVEDPVEYQLQGVTQIPVKQKIGLGFAESLRAIMRQDPDVIMVGEIRDRETAEVAIQAALTGHLVMATLHTNSAAAAIDRLRDMGVEDYLIAATVVGALAQRLVRRLCPDCAAPEEPAFVARMAPGAPTGGFRAARGCGACGGTGYRGRIGVHEVLVADAAFHNAVLDRRGGRDLAAVAEAGGMTSMAADGVAKAARGETSLTEIARVAAGI